MALALQVMVTGLAVGAVYGLVAIGFALIYRLTGVIHFALGELVGLAVFATLFFAAGTGPVSQTNVPAGRYAFALVLGMVTSIVAGVLVYLAGVRPFLKRGSTMGWIGGTVAIAFVVRGLLEATFTRPAYVFPDPFPFDKLAHGGVIQLGGGSSVQVRTFFVIGVASLLALGAAFLLNRTRAGAALRAITADRRAAELVGVPVERYLALAFALAGAIAAVAAILAAPGSPVSVDDGALLGLKGLVAAVIGGFVLPRRVFVAGLALGVLETTVASFHVGAVRLGSSYADVVPLALAIAFIAFTRALARDSSMEVG